MSLLSCQATELVIYCHIYFHLEGVSMEIQFIQVRVTQLLTDLLDV